jgi:RNA polymerase sigma factor (sigma-70 family)
MALSPSIALLRTQTDERLVALARQGHERAFDAIVERYRRPLLRACRRFLPEARAEDALQQALIQAWRGLVRGDEVRDLRGWLYRIAHNTALNALRVSGFDHEELAESARGSVDGPEEEVERRAVVRQTLAGLAALPERQREALLRLAVEGASQEEVARDLGLSEGAVRQLVFRARGALRATATAIVPMPLAGWLAAGGGGAAAAGGAGATLAKVSAVAVIAGGMATAPVVFDHEGAERANAAKTPRTATVAKSSPAMSSGAADESAGLVESPDHDDRANLLRAGPNKGADEPGRQRSSRGGRSDKDADERSGSGGRGDDPEDRDEDRSGPGGGDRESEDAGEDRSALDDSRRGRGRGRGGDDKPDEDESVDEDASGAGSGSGSGGGGSDDSAEDDSGPGGGGEADPVPALEPNDPPKPDEALDSDESDSSGTGSGGGEDSSGSGSGKRSADDPLDD